MPYLSFSVWFITLSIIPSRSIYVVTNGRISYFLMPEYYSIVCVYRQRYHMHIYKYHTYVHIYVYIHTYHIFLIHSSPDRHSGCFHILANVTNNATDMVMQLSLQDPVFFFFGYITPRSEIVGSHGSSSLNFLRNLSVLFSIWSIQIYIPTCVQGFPFLHTLANTCYFLSF